MTFFAILSLTSLNYLCSFTLFNKIQKPTVIFPYMKRLHNTTNFKRKNTNTVSNHLPQPVITKQQIVSEQSPKRGCITL